MFNVTKVIIQSCTLGVFLEGVLYFIVGVLGSSLLYELFKLRSGVLIIV